MNVFNKGGRYVRIFGTEGEIIAAIDGNEPIVVNVYINDTTEKIEYYGLDSFTGGHAQAGMVE